MYITYLLYYYIINNLEGWIVARLTVKCKGFVFSPSKIRRLNEIITNIIQEIQ